MSLDFERFAPQPHTINSVQLSVSYQSVPVIEVREFLQRFGCSCICFVDNKDNCLLLITAYVNETFKTFKWNREDEQVYSIDH